MKLVLLNGNVIAAHDDEQDTDELYPGTTWTWVPDKHNPFLEEGFGFGFAPVPVVDELQHYRKLRKAHYPPLEDYMDGIVKGDAVQIQAYIDACKAVKLRYPKP